MAGPNYQTTATTNNESDSRVKPLSYKFFYTITFFYRITYPKQSGWIGGLKIHIRQTGHNL